jgi:hypothetical protein
LIHIKFPNCVKLIIDARGNGENLPHLFYETWEYVDEQNKKVTEFPPLIKDDDDEAKLLKNAIPLIRAVTATNIYNNTMYTFMKSCFEDNSIKLPAPATEMDNEFKENILSTEEYAVFIETDLLIQELSNIKQEESNFKNIIYNKIVNTAKRDRATSLGYGLAYINEIEIYNRKNLNSSDEDYNFYIYN